MVPLCEDFILIFVFYGFVLSNDLYNSFLHNFYISYGSVFRPSFPSNILQKDVFAYAELASLIQNLMDISINNHNFVTTMDEMPFMFDILC